MNKCFIQDIIKEKITNNTQINISILSNQIDISNISFNDKKIKIENNLTLPNGNFQSNTNNQINNVGLPNIENFFLQKDKVFLVDCDKNVWHLKKCKRFENIQNKFNKNENFNKEEILNEFLEFYQNNSENKIKNQVNENEIEDMDNNQNNKSTGVLTIKNFKMEENSNYNI